MCDKEVQGADFWARIPAVVEVFMTNHVGIVSDLRFCDHRVPPSFPESPERIRAIDAALRASGLLANSFPIQPRPATDTEILRAHTEEFLERLNDTDWSSATFFDEEEVPVSPETFNTARHAAGSVIEAIDAVMGGAVSSAFCAVRPPGHHAESNHAMGFCLLNNVAIGTRHLLHHHGIDRVLVLDWDLHHGNGTQEILQADRRVMFCSLHGHPDQVYPNTGYEDETGEHGGTVLNVPLLPGTSDRSYREAFEKIVLPAAAQYRPQFILVSAGFDAHKDDPMEVLKLETETYAWMTHKLLEIAKASANGRLVSVLEGGYNIEALAASVVAHVGALSK